MRPFNQTRTRRTALQVLAIVIFTVLMLGQTIFAQTSTKAPDRGFSPGKSYSISDIESIAMQSGNLMLNMPLGSLPAGRGGISAGVNLSYNSKLWDQHSTEVEDIFHAPATRDILSLSEEGGWRYGYKYYFKVDSAGVGCYSGDLFHNKIQLVMPDGGTHVFVPGSGTNALSNAMDFSPISADGQPACGTPLSPGQTVTLFSIDNSFLRIEVTTDSDSNIDNNQWTLYAPDGSRVVNNPGSGVSQRIYDRNNNYIDIIETAVDSSYSNHKTVYLQDTALDRKVVIEYSGATDEDWIHSKGVAGVAVKTKVKWKTIAVNKIYMSGDFDAPSPHPDNYYKEYSLNQTIRVVDRISLPAQIDSSLYYEFQYNADATSATDTGWGEVSRVKLPSEAYTDYEYRYDGTQSSPLDVGTVLRNGVVEKKLTYDLEYDNSSTSTNEVWTYERIGDEPVTEATMTAPDGGETTEYYGMTGSVPTPPTPPNFLPSEVYKTVMPDGTVIEKWYQSNAPGVSNVSGYPNTLYKANRFVKYEFVSIPNNAGTLTKTAVKEYSRDKNGNVTEVKEYDFFPYSGTGSVPRSSGRPNGLPSGATPLRITKTEYYNDTPDATSTTYTDTDSYNVSTSPRLLRLAKSMEVQDGSATSKSRSEITYDYTSYSSNTKAGNATETKVWDSFKGGDLRSWSNPLTPTNSISTSATYDAYGNPTQTTDANGVQTTITYGSINGYTGLYPTQTEAASNFSGVKRTSTAVYDFSTGLVTSTTDEDNDVTSATEYDELGRPVKAVAGVGTALEFWTQTVYDDVKRRVIVKSDLETKGDARKIAVQHYDQLGRVRLSRTIENPDTEDPTDEGDGIKVQTRYKISGDDSYQLSSNPYRAATSSGASSEPSMGWTRSKTVKTGRHSEVETFTGATLPQPFLTSGDNTNSTGKVQTDRDAQRTLVTDQAGKQRISQSNALGQLTDVWEIRPSSESATASVAFPTDSGIAYGYKTSYSYDPLSNLATVSQPIGSSGGQTRSFTYSSLSRLLTAANPESGTISYVYDNNGNLTSKTDARSITTTYTYDELNRIVARDYSDSTPDVTYTYGSIAPAVGKLTKVSSDISETRYTAFDLLGRVTASEQRTPFSSSETISTATPQVSSYSYNLSGALIEETYPSGRKVKNVLDNNGDLSMVQSKKSASYGYWNYAQNFTYTAAGAVSSMQLGNFKWESTVFNARLQPTRIALGSTQAAYDILKLDFDYGSTANKGNVQSQTITVPTVGINTGFSAVQTYTYDSLNRIKDAKENINGGSTPEWKQTFDYDRFGNRNFDEANTTANALSFPKSCGTTPNFTMCTADKKIYNPAIDSSNNRLSTSDGYTFDYSGNTTKDAQSRKFTYDAENKQIKVETVNSGGTVTGTIGEYAYDGDGKRVRKYVPSTGETTIFVYDASGKLVEEYSTIVTAQQDAKVSYLTNDHLGSPRINTDQNGAVTARHDYQPFGEEIATSQRISGLGYNSDDIRRKFTSYERDEESDLDFAEVRYYNPAHGRFTAVDPLMASANINSPQTFNRYSYVMNNPLNLVDPSGMISECPAGQTCQKDDDGNEFFIDKNGLKIIVAGVSASLTIVTGLVKTSAQGVAKQSGGNGFGWFLGKIWGGAKLIGGATVNVATGAVGFILTNPIQGAPPNECIDANGNNFCRPSLSTEPEPAGVDEGDNPDKTDNEPSGNKEKDKEKARKKNPCDFGLPDVPIGTQLAGSGEVPALRSNPNLGGLGADEILRMTPRELGDLVKQGKISKNLCHTIKKHFEKRDKTGKGKNRKK